MTVLDASIDLDAPAVTTIRTLCIDAVQANPGIRGRRWRWRRSLHAVAAVPALRPRRPDLAERDRFVPSAGHASTLLYSCST